MGMNCDPPATKSQAVAGKPFSSSVAGFALIAIALLLVVPVALSTQPYWLGVATNVCMLSVGSLGVWAIFVIGRVDLAQGAFAMLGGYATAILSARFGLSFWLCLPLSVALSAAVGAIIGLAIMPLRGVY